MIGKTQGLNSSAQEVKPTYMATYSLAGFSIAWFDYNCQLHTIYQTTQGGKLVARLADTTLGRTALAINQ